MLLRDEFSTLNDETLVRAGEQVLLAGLGQTRNLGQDADLLMLMVAMSLAPRAAVAYEASNPAPRWRLVFDYLNCTLTFLNAEELRKVSRRVAVILDNWDERREPGSEASVHRLLRKSENRCAICRLPFHREPASVTTRDVYKPVHEAPAELSRPEIDHIVSLALSGTNVPSNFQVLCRACNAAKGSGLDISTATEVRFAGADLVDVPRIHRFRMFQWIATRVDSRCRGCGDDREEVTVRLRREGMTYVRPNLDCWCYGCLCGR